MAGPGSFPRRDLFFGGNMEPTRLVILIVASLVKIICTSFLSLKSKAVASALKQSTTLSWKLDTCTDPINILGGKETDINCLVFIGENMNDGQFDESEEVGIFKRFRNFFELPRKLEQDGNLQSWALLVI